MAKKTRAQQDRRIDTLQLETVKLIAKLEKIIAEMEALSPHSVNGDIALNNTRQWLLKLVQGR